MTAIAVVGSQWGDEGKGKITDFLSKEAAMAVRSNGGNNAGHTIEIGDKTFKMRLIPSGIFAVPYTEPLKFFISPYVQRYGLSHPSYGSDGSSGVAQCFISWITRYPE